MTCWPFHTNVRAVVCVLVFGSSAGFAATTIRVPADQPTIQAGINAASNGDTVLVAPGTYHENINFKGKAITVSSTGRAKVTIIDGGGITSVVTFNSNETATSVLSGFTIQNGNAYNAPAGQEGGGIAVDQASPIIKDNIIQNNFGKSTGGGIDVYFGSPLIEGNIIRNNSQTPLLSGGSGGGGLGVGGNGATQIIGNVIEHNTWPTAFGGGLTLFAAGSVLVKNNLFMDNTSADGGNALYMANTFSGALIVQNVFIGNNSKNGSTVYWSDSPGAVISNTFADGPSTTPNFSIFSVTGVESYTVIANNVITATDSGTVAFYCTSGDFSSPSNFYNNDVYSKGGSAYGGLCTSQTGSNTNISASPMFLTKSNVRLQGGSPAIDAGNNSAPDLPSTDFAGNPRIINGNDGPSATVDMGAYEFVPITLKPSSLNFGLQAVGSTTTKTFTLTNAQNKSLTISSETPPTGYKVSGCGTSVAEFSSCTLTVTFQPSTTGSFKEKITITDNAGNSPQSISVSGSAH